MTVLTVLAGAGCLAFCLAALVLAAIGQDWLGELLRRHRRAVFVSRHQCAEKRALGDNEEG